MERVEKRLGEKWYEKWYEKGVEKGVEDLSEKEQIIIKLMKANPKISKEQIKERGNISKKSVDYNIDKLKKKGILKRIGPAKGGYWKIVEVIEE